MSIVQWLAPSPLWENFSAPTEKARLRQPTLLRFATDSFMEDLQTVLAQRPATLSDYVAQPETWEAPAAGLRPLADTRSSTLPLKLYQPVHQRFYLVAAALACRVPGLPDHTLRQAQGEQVTFVLRRVAPLSPTADIRNPMQRTEHAWVNGEHKGWTRAAGAGLVTSEEQLPLFPMRFGVNGKTRRLFAGLVPASNRQAYATGRVLDATATAAGASGTAGAASAAADDPRLIEFQRRVLDPWIDLLDWHERTVVPSGSQANGDVVAAREQGSALVLLDFANFLSDHLSPLWQAIENDVAPPAGPLRNLFNALGHTLTVQNTGAAVTLRQALVQARQAEAALEGATLSVPPTLPPGYPRVTLTDPNPAVRTLINRDAQQQRPLATLMSAAPTSPPAPAGSTAGASGGAVRAPARDPASPQGDDWFVARCVYTRPQCGPGHLPLLSDPSEPFQLASFFDPDAPARSLQVALPIDTTPAALRRYDKGVGFLISDELAKQMNRVQGLKKLMDGELGGPGLGIGMICSLSIPIITICAFIVLFIFLYLLNIIFWWIPFFKICFPVPTLKAKGG